MSNIIRSTLGDNLSELKSLMDAKGDVHSLHKLIFHDIRCQHYTPHRNGMPHVDIGVG